MTNVLLAVKLLLTVIFSGIAWAVEHGRKPAEQYLQGLRRLVTITFLPPLLVSGIALIFGWRTLVGWMGVWCFIWTVVLGHYAVPLGALIDALTTIGKKKVAADGGEHGWLASRLKTYIGVVRQLLIYEAAGFITLNFLPIQNYWTGVPMFALIVGLLIVTSYEWNTETGKWLKPFARFASFGGIVFLIISFFFPGINFFNLLIYGGKPEKLVEKGLLKKEEILHGTKDITEEQVGGLVKGVGVWIGDHWNKPSFWVGLAIAALLAYLLVRLFKKAVAPAGTAGSDHHAVTTSSHGSGGTGKGWLGMALGIALLLLVIALIGKVLMGAHEERDARIESGMREARLYEQARAAIAAKTTASLVAEVNGRTATQSPAPAPAPTEWCDLRKVTLHRFQFTTNWSMRIPRPEGMSVRISPAGLDPETRINGTRILVKNPSGMTEFPPGTRFFEVRSMDAARSPTEMTVGVGYEN